MQRRTADGGARGDSGNQVLPSLGGPNEDEDEEEEEGRSGGKSICRWKWRFRSETHYSLAFRSRGMYSRIDEGAREILKLGAEKTIMRNGRNGRAIERHCLEVLWRHLPIHAPDLRLSFCLQHQISHLANKGQMDGVGSLLYFHLCATVCVLINIIFFACSNHCFPWGISFKTDLTLGTWKNPLA